MRPMNPGPETPAGPALDPVAQAILELLEACPAGKSISPHDAARALAVARAGSSAPNTAWRRYTTVVRQQALHLARQGRIVILRKGKPVDPHAPVKGLIRLAPKGWSRAGDG